MSQRIVIKVGGASLCHPQGFQSQLRLLLDEFRSELVYVMVGGGELVESMRTAHRIYPNLSTEDMHWHCVYRNRAGDLGLDSMIWSPHPQ